MIGNTPTASFNMTRPLVFHVIVKDLRALEISGSSKFMVGQVQANDMDLRISCSGEISFGQLTDQSLTANIDGSGNVQSKGNRWAINMLQF